jgi:sulfate/thiosulfate-binding protein
VWKKSRSKAFLALILMFTLVLGACGSGGDGNTVELLNVSYDPTRELYQEFNEAFAAHWQQTNNQTVEIRMSHGGSGKQSRSVIDGMQADVVTLALGYDIDAIASKGIINKDWANSFEHASTPYYSTIVLLVRKGNPKNIRDWNDLIRDDVEVITPNPKTSGGARWNYLAAYGYALQTMNRDEQKAKQFMKQLYQNVTVLDAGARGSTTTFVERQIGDVLISWENEALMAVNELGSDKFEIINPSISIAADPPVAVVDQVVEKKGTRQAATAYLNYLYTEEGQAIIAKHYFRPRMESVLAQHADRFPPLNLLTIADFGGWTEVQTAHFADDGWFDQIYTQ